MSGPACLAGSAGPAEAPRASAGPRRLGFVALTAALALAAAPAAAQTTGPAVVVPDVDAPLATGQPYPLQLSIAGRQIVEDVDLRVTRLYHEQPDELDMLLVGPGGESTLILSDVGASAAVTGGTFRFDDEALGPVSDLLLSGSYRPTDLSDDPPDVIPAPAPSGPYGSSLSVFDNTVADGVWNLYVVDDTAFDGGQILAVSLSVNGRPARRLTPHAERATIAEDPGAVATIRVRRTAAGGAATVSFVAGAATSDAPATPGNDFEALSGTLVFAPSETEKTISVPITDDDRFELAEQLSVMLAGPRGDASLTSRTFATVTIRDDDPPALRLRAQKLQRPLRSGRVIVSARSSPGSRLRAGGTVALPGAGRIRLIGARGRVGSGQPRRLALRLRRAARRKLTGAFEEGARLTARITVTATNDGRSAAARSRVKLRR
jgi:Calx-beta domain